MSEIPIGTMCLVRCPVCSARVGGTAVVTGPLAVREGYTVVFGALIRVEWNCYVIEGRLGETQCGTSCITPITPPDDSDALGGQVDDQLEVAA